MKFSIILKLFSVLLCVCMLFVACDNPTNEAGSEETTSVTETAGETGTENNNETETEAELTDEELLSGVTANRDNFFKLFTPNTSAISTAVRPLTKVDKAVMSGKVVLYTTKTIDAKNNVTEKIDVFNTDEGKTVLTVSATYQNGDYDDFDWDNLIVREYDEIQNIGDSEEPNYVIVHVQEKKYPSSALEVSLESCYGLPYILVKSADIKAIDEATREENPDGGVYQIDVKYTYYDIFGTKITESNTELSVSSCQSSMWNPTNAIFGSIVAVFDPETGRMIRSCDENDRQLIGAYDDETDKYGYFFGRSYLGAQFVEIYNKQTGELLDRYYFDDHYLMSQSFVLHNGDILIQQANPVEEGDPYDYYYDGNYYAFTSVLFDVSERKADVIDFPYVVYWLERGENIAASLNSQGIAITDNVRNIGVVYPIENKLQGDAEALVFDNDMSVLYRIDRIIPEHAFDSEALELGFKVLKNGDYLVSLNTNIPSVSYAIVKPDGTIRTYLKDTYTLGDDFIYDSATAKIYDYDMNLVLQLGDSNTNYDPYVFDRVIDGTFILVRESQMNNAYAERYSIEKSSDSYEINSLFEGQKVSIESDSSDAYVLVREEKTQNYVLYNTAMEHILTSENVINVYEGDGYFTLSTYSNVLKQTLIYTVTE
ncbi:MAG: hypothetical protein ACI3X1_02345 [Eubacteriales bacterium]